MHDQIVTEVLVAMRGNRDRMSISKELGFSYNQYFKFEARYKILRLEDFIQICGLKNQLCIKKTLEDVFEMELYGLSQNEIINGICRVWGVPTERVLKDELDISTSKWWRIKNGKSSLSFVDFLRFVDVQTGKLNTFLNLFLDKSTLERMFKGKVDAEDALLFLKNNPETSLITTGIILKDYIEAKDENKLAVLQKLTKIPKDRFEFYLETLLQKNICYYEGSTLKARTFRTEVRETELEVGKSIYNYTLEAMQDYLQGKDFDEHPQFLNWATKIAPVSKTAKEDIRAIISRSYQEICEVIENDPLDNRTEHIILNQGLLTLQ